MMMTAPSLFGLKVIRIEESEIAILMQWNFPIISELYNYGIDYVQAKETFDQNRPISL